MEDPGAELDSIVHSLSAHTADGYGRVFSRISFRWQLWLLRNRQLGRNVRTLRSSRTFGLFVEGIQKTNPAQRAAMRSSCYNMFRIECQLSGMHDPGEEVYDMMHRGWVWFPDESGIAGPFDGK